MTQMRYFAIITVGFLALAGCATIGPQSSVDDPEISCFTQPQGGCSFDQSPLRVLDEPVTLPRRPYKFFPTAAPLNFVDAEGQSWVAPPRTLTDGASIPKIFVTIVGDPTSPEFVNAAAVHDAYCGIGNEGGANYQRAPWQDVHLMFYDGLIVGGTDHIRAKVMFAAVWLGGPRWAEPAEAVISTQGRSEARAYDYINRLDLVPVWRKQQAMRRAKAYIERNDPPIPRLLDFLGRLEDEMLFELTRGGDADQEKDRDPTPREMYPNMPLEPVNPGTGGVTAPVVPATAAAARCDGTFCF